MNSFELEYQWSKIFGKTALLIIPDCPNELELGLDCMVYQTTSKFKGISMIPMGIHIVYYSYSNFPRQGFFFEAIPGELILKPWNKTTEEIDPETTILSNETKYNLMFSILSGSWNDSLSPYSVEQEHIWRNISYYLQPDVFTLAKITIDATILPGDTNLEPTMRQTIFSSLQSRAKAQSKIEHQQDKSIEEKYLLPSFCSISFYHTKMIESIYQQQENSLLIGEEITSVNQDQSNFLRYLLSQYYQSFRTFLGELQLSFILFMFLYSYPSLQQWKELLVLISSCEQYLLSQENSSKLLIKCLFHQLKFIPDDFFQHEISADNFLLPMLSNLFSSMISFQQQSSSATTRANTGNILEYKYRFEKYLYKRFNIRIVYEYIDPIESASDNITEVENNKQSVKQWIKDCSCVIDSNFKIEVNYPQTNEVETESMMDLDQKKSLNQISELDNKFVEHNLDTFFDQQAFESIEQLSKSEEKLSEVEENVLSIEEANPIPDFFLPIPLKEKELLKYSWRYPMLYESMCSSQLNEDMIMTAMRILDEIPENQENDNKLRIEAVEFLTNEVPLY